MYEKMKATKNNNFKKASVFAAMAVLASCAAMLHPGQLFNGGSSNSTYAMMDVFDWGVDAGSNAFGGYGSWNTFGKRMGSVINNPELKDEYAKRYSKLFRAMFNWLAQHGLNLVGYGAGSIPIGRSRGTVADLILKYISKDNSFGVSKLRSFAFVQATGDLGRDTVRLAEYLNELVKAQVQMYKIVHLILSLVNLPSMKNSGKLEAVKKLKENGTYEDISAAIGLSEINKSRLGSAASKLAGAACRSFLRGTVWDPNDKGSSFEDYLHRFADVEDSTSKSALNKLKVTLSGILQLNDFINKTIRRCAAFRTLLNAVAAQDVLAENAANSGDVSLAVLAATKMMQKKQYFDMISNGFTFSGKDGKEVKIPGVPEGNLILALPLLSLEPEMLAKLSGMQVDDFGSIREGMISGIADGIKPSRAYAGAKSFKTTSLYNSKIKGVGSFTYDFAEALTSVFDNDKSFVTEVLSALDASRQKNLKDVLEILEKKQKSDGSVSDEQAAKEKSKKLMRQQMGIMYNGGNSFVSKSKAIEKSEVTFDVTGLSDLLSDVFGVPGTILTMGVGKALAKDLKNGQYDGYWLRGGAATPWLKNLSASIGEVCAELDKAHSASQSLSKEIADIKADKTGTIKKSSEEAADKKVISQIAVFNGNNTVNNAVSMSAMVATDAAGKKTINLVFSGLSDKDKKASVVICPKYKDFDKKDKDGKPLHKDIELPTVDVKDGKAVFDVTSALTSKGLFEAHLRDESEGKHEFKVKAKAFYDADGVKRTDEIKSTFTKSGNMVDTKENVPTMYKNDDGSVTVDNIKLKDAASGTRIVAIAFEQGKDANLETDQIGGDCDANGMVSVTTSSAMAEPNKLQIHFYKNELSEGNFIGKIEGDQSSKSALSISSKKSDLSSALAKSSVKASNSKKSAETHEKTMWLKLPMILPMWGTNGYADASDYYKTGKEIRIEFINDKDEVVASQDVELGSEKSGSENSWYSGYGLFSGKDTATFKVTLDVPETEEGLKLRICDVPSSWNDGRSMLRVVSLDSSDKVTIKTESDKVISFNPVNGRTLF